MADLKEATYSVAGGYDIHLKEAGSGPAVVFIHGSGPGASGSSNFRRNIDAFVDAGFRVILPDLIGYGASSKPEGIDYSLELFTNTLYDALRQHGVEKASLIGNSLGGAIAIQMTLDHPEFSEKLIMMAPGAVAEQASYFTLPGIAKMRSGFGGPDFNLEEQRRLIGNLMHPDSAHLISDELVAERFAVASTQPVRRVEQACTKRQHISGVAHCDGERGEERDPLLLTESAGFPRVAVPRDAQVPARVPPRRQIGQYIVRDAEAAMTGLDTDVQDGE